MDNTTNQRNLIAAWYQACRAGRFDMADYLWEKFIELLKVA
jgi:hypothetical protein